MPGPSGSTTYPSAITGPPLVRSSSKNGTDAACHSSARKFGIEAQTWADASVPTGPAMLCGATGLEWTSAERRDAARVREPPDLLDVGREDVDAAESHERGEAVEAVEVLACADRGRRPLGDPRDGREILRWRRILEPEQRQVLERAGEPQRVRRCVAPVQVERDVRPACDRVDRRRRERDLSLELGGRDRSRVEVLVLEKRKVEVELQRGEPALGHLARACGVGVRCVHVVGIRRRPVHLRLGPGELVVDASPIQGSRRETSVAL